MTLQNKNKYKKLNKTRKRITEVMYVFNKILTTPRVSRGVQLQTFKINENALQASICFLAHKAYSTTSCLIPLSSTTQSI